MRPFLIVQTRPERDTADDEAAALVRFGGIGADEYERIAIDREPLPDIDLDDWAGIIVGGGPANFSLPDDRKSPEQRRFEPWLFALARACAAQDFPYFGACLGLGALVHGLGARMEYGVSEPAAPVEVTVVGVDPLLAGLPTTFTALGGHKEGIETAPPGVDVLAVSDRCVQIVRHGRHVYATQFHPELDPVGLELRIRTYLEHGYFAPGDAERLIALGHAADISAPMTFLRRFVELARKHTNARTPEGRPSVPRT